MKNGNSSQATINVSNSYKSTGALGGQVTSSRSEKENPAQNNSFERRLEQSNGQMQHCHSINDTNSGNFAILKQNHTESMEISELSNGLGGRYEQHWNQLY